MYRSPQYASELGFNPNEPFVVIEGRAPLLGQQVTRQTYLPLVLQEEHHIRTIYIEAHDPATYTSEGLIRAYTIYGGQAHTLETGGFYAPAWRLRDLAWPSGDMPAFLPGQGYNSPALRRELATRFGMAQALGRMGLQSKSVQSMSIGDGAEPAQWAESDFVFIKPRLVHDIGANDPGAMTRARRVAAGEITPSLLAQFGENAILQNVEPTMAAVDLLGDLGVKTAAELEADCLHALRVYQPLWLPHNAPPAAELRLSNPGDVGQRFATELHLLEPEHLFSSLPNLDELHSTVCTALLGEYGELNYPAVDYLIMSDGSVKILNVLARALSPNLPEPDREQPAMAHLARATADVEISKLAELALGA